VKRSQRTRESRYHRPEKPFVLKESPMLRTTALALVPILTLSLIGCGETSGVKEEIKTTTPGGTEKVTKDMKVEKSGPNPPSTTDVPPPSK
jgi:hypothetical protein